MKRVVSFGFFLICTAVHAQDPELTDLGRTLLAVRQFAASRPGIRGGIPELTTIKHQLRNWIEARLASYPRNGDPATLSDQILKDLSDAALFCDDPSDCTSNALGYLDQVQIKGELGFLIITTAAGTGIRCGYDCSPYLYGWQGNHWRRVWENEQNNYAEGSYRPQTLHSVHVSEPANDGSRLILTLGTPAGCTGAFVPLYSRLWQIGVAGSEASLILDRSEILNDESEPPAIAKLTADDVLIEFAAGGTGYGETHKALRHFEIHGGTVEQTDPIAPTPRDFVEEWLAAPWQESATRSNSAALREWHTRLHRDDGQGDYPEPAVSCDTGASLVQIATHLEGSPQHYFLVRRTAPLHFVMTDIGDRPFAGCTRPDPDADKQPSLIPANQ
jgi:hypothetical protein